MRRPGITRLAVAGTLAAAVVLTGGGVAFANGGDAIGLDVTNSHITVTGVDGQCTWDVASTVTVVNLTSTTLDVSGVNAQVSWTGPGNRSGVADATITSDAGLAAGDTIGPNATATYKGLETTFTIPCNATFGDLAVRIIDQYGTGSGDAPFLDGGTPLPVTAVGGLTLAALLGGSLVVLQRRRRRPVPAVSDQR